MNDQTDLKYSTALRIFEITVRTMSKLNADMLRAALEDLQKEIEREIMNLPHEKARLEPQRDAVKEAFEECLIRLNARLQLPG